MATWYGGVMERGRMWQSMDRGTAVLVSEVVVL